MSLKNNVRGRLGWVRMVSFYQHFIRILVKYVYWIMRKSSTKERTISRESITIHGD